MKYKKWGIFLTTSQKKCVMIPQVYLIASQQEEIRVYDRSSQIYFSPKIFYEKTRNLLPKNKKPSTENKKPSTENHETSNNFMSRYVGKYVRYSQNKIGAERANVGLLEAVFDLSLRGFISSKSSSEC